MKVAITGATGFLGRHLIQIAREEGHQVQGWVHRREHPVEPGIRWIPGRLDDPRSTEELAAGCDVVIHAALARGDGGFLQAPTDPISYYQTNVVGSMRLMEAAKRNGCRRFIFISSGAVHQRVVEDHPLDDRHPLWPASLYGACKAAVETLVHSYGFSGSLDCASVRPVSIYGLERPVEQSKFYSLVRNAMNDKEVDVSGGSKVVHVADVAKAAWLLATTNEPIAGETFPCCDRFVSHEEVAGIISEFLGKPLRILGEPKRSSQSIDSSKLELLGMQFGGKPLLQQTIASMIDQFCQ